MIIQQNVLIDYYSGVDAHDCKCWNGEHLGMIVRSHTQFSSLVPRLTHGSGNEANNLVASILAKNNHSVTSPVKSIIRHI